MKRAVIYGRVSTADKQDYKHQVDLLELFAQRNDYKIIETFTEKVSGTKKDRVEFNRMLDYVRTNKIDSILVTELSRFGRIGLQTRIAVEQLAEEGIDVYFHDRSLHTVLKGKINSDAMMIVGLLADIAKKELETLEARIKSGLRFSAKNNGALSGKYQPYGFKSMDKKLMIDEEEAKVITEIFNHYKSGLGTSQIAKHLNNKKIPTRFYKLIGNNLVKTKSGEQKKGTDYTWSQGTIIGILKNELYKGVRIHKGEVVGNTTPIISPELFADVQRIIKNKTNTPTKVIINENPLKHIIKCGVCGNSYYIKKRKSGKDNAYKCITTKWVREGKIKYCGSPAINIDKLINSLFLINSKIIHKRLDVSSKKYLIEMNNRIENTEIKINNSKANLRKNNTKLDNLYEDFNERIIPKTHYLKLKSKYEDDILKSETEIEELIAELSDLKKVKKNPKTDYNTIEIFKKNIKEIIKVVSISPFKSDDKTIKIKVKVKLVAGDTITYVLTRYTKMLTNIEHKFETANRKDGEAIQYPNLKL